MFEISRRPFHKLCLVTFGDGKYDYIYKECVCCKEYATYLVGASYYESSNYYDLYEYHDCKSVELSLSIFLSALQHSSTIPTLMFFPTIKYPKLINPGKI